MTLEVKEDFEVSGFTPFKKGEVKNFSSNFAKKYENFLKEPKVTTLKTTPKKEEE